MQLTTDQINNLVKKAIEMQQYSHIPYSRFAVGAALLAKNGTVYTGCNVENAAFTPSNCAERTAFFKAVSEGVKEFEAIAIAGGHNRLPDSFCPPCGVCRQVLREFCPLDFEILSVTSAEPLQFRRFTLEELLPYSFGPEFIH